MRLVDLEARFLRVAHPGHFTGTEFEHAQGIVFLCPLCFRKNGGEVGTHSVIVWFAERGVPDNLDPKGRWEAVGTCLNDLTVTPSIQVVGGCAWHGYVVKGEVSIL